MHGVDPAGLQAEAWQFAFIAKGLISGAQLQLQVWYPG
jgi:hypothetical protein